MLKNVRIFGTRAAVTPHWAGKASSLSKGKWLKRALGAALKRDRSRVYFWEPANGLIIGGTQLPVDGCFGNHLAQRDGYIALVAVRTIGSLENIFGKFGHFLVHSVSEYLCTVYWMQ